MTRSEDAADRFYARVKVAENENEILRQRLRDLALPPRRPHRVETPADERTLLWENDHLRERLVRLEELRVIELAQHRRAEAFTEGQRLVSLRAQRDAEKKLERAVTALKALTPKKA